MPDLSKVIEWEDFATRRPNEREGCGPLKEEAQNFLQSFKWCREVVNSYIGIAHPGIIGVFLFNIEPSRNDVDEWIWIIVGDLPPAYLTCEECPNPATAIDSYIGAMLEWVAAASAGESVEELIPINMSATKENAEALKLRLDFLDAEILPKYAADLTPVNP